MKLANQPERLAYSRESAAEALDCSLRSVDKLIEQGELKAQKVGRRILIPYAELERLVMEGMRHDTKRV